MSDFWSSKCVLCDVPGVHDTFSSLLLFYDTIYLEIGKHITPSTLQGCMAGQLLELDLSFGINVDLGSRLQLDLFNSVQMMHDNMGGSVGQCLVSSPSL